MRCFIAIDLPEEVREKIYGINKILDGIKHKPVEKHNLHLTLKFLGEINDYRANWVIERLKSLKIKKFKAWLNGLGVFPDENFIRVLWIGVEPSSTIHQIHKQIDDALEKYFKKDKRFQSHITISRIKSLKDKKDFLEKIKSIRVEAGFCVEEIKLKRSILKREGPEYDDLYVFKLL